MINGKKILFLPVILIFSISLSAQISPGELTRAHSHLEGISNCKKCHDLGKKAASSKCIECHLEIKRLQSEKEGYHSSIEVKGKECFSCHSEHNGKTFAIIRLDTASFKHSLTGYELAGRHQKLHCADCHKGSLIREKVSQKKRGVSYLGLDQECFSCHKDYHQGTLPGKCTNCHTENSFKPAEKFTHATTKYPLRGKHAGVLCIGCHKISERNGEKFQEFAGVRYQNCTDCHKDIHDNKFGSDCLKCHTEESFRAPKASQGFDHSRTNYPLEGKHIPVECKACHKQAYTVKIKHKLCSDCHKDYHKGQFAKPGLSIECSDCHTINGFIPSLFTIEKHARTKFTLEGAHLATPCISCHKKTGEWNFTIPQIRCVDCHENIHAGRIAEKFMPQQSCKACHTSSTWSAITFDHNITIFPLKGKHSEVSCRQCHFKLNPGLPDLQRFADLTISCLECHPDEHQGQFELETPTGCAQCHGFVNWKVPQFNHDTTRYKLDGKHVFVECRKCHQRISSGGRQYTLYKTNKLQCKDCHS